MSTQESNIKMPFHVVTTDGKFRSGHENMAMAEAGAIAANKQAEALGIATRYKAVEKGE